MEHEISEAHDENNNGDPVETKQSTSTLLTEASTNPEHLTQEKQSNPHKHCQAIQEKELEKATVCRKVQSTSFPLCHQTPNFTPSMKLNPILELRRGSLSHLKFQQNDSVPPPVRESVLTSENSSNLHNNNHHPISKVRMTAVFENSFDQEWQAKIKESFFQDMNPYHHLASSPDLQQLQNLLTTLPFHVMFVTVEMPVLLPTLSLSTFFDTFMPSSPLVAIEFPHDPFTATCLLEAEYLFVILMQEICSGNTIAEDVETCPEIVQLHDRGRKCGETLDTCESQTEMENLSKSGSEHKIVGSTALFLKPDEIHSTGQPRIRYNNFSSKALRSIVSSSRISDVFSWRLVNKHWNSICCSRLQRAVISKITFTSEAQIQIFIQTSLNPKISIFNSFSLNQVVIRPPLPSWEFFLRLGPSCIRKLELQDDLVIWVDRFRALLQHLPNLEVLSTGINRFRGTRLFPEPAPSDEFGNIDLPVLKKLKTVNFSGGGAGGASSFHEFLQDFFSHFAPNVEIILSNPVPEDVPSISKEFQDKLVCASLSLRNLRKFGFPIFAGELTLKKLAGCRLPLEELVLIIKESQIRSEVILKLLKSVATTLKNCELTFELYEDGRKQIFEIPRFKNLERLVLKNYYGGVDGLGFLYKCPALKYLDLSMTDAYETMLPEKLAPLENIEEAKLCPIAYSSSWAFQKILGIFPKLRRLTVECAEDFALRAIFLEVDTLEELCLKGTFTDEGVTGIPKEKCKEILRLGALNPMEVEQIRESVCISYLKNLRQLHLESSCITDAAIVMGVVDAKSLIEVTIGARKITDVSLIAIIQHLHCLKRLHFLKTPLVSRELKLSVWADFREEIDISFQDIMQLVHPPPKEF